MSTLNEKQIINGERFLTGILKVPREDFNKLVHTFDLNDQNSNLESTIMESLSKSNFNAASLLKLSTKWNKIQLAKDIFQNISV